MAYRIAFVSALYVTLFHHDHFVPAVLKYLIIFQTGSLLLFRFDESLAGTYISALRV
jgi:hypothetical protein